MSFSFGAAGAHREAFLENLKAQSSKCLEALDAQLAAEPGEGATAEELATHGRQRGNVEGAKRAVLKVVDDIHDLVADEPHDYGYSVSISGHVEAAGTDASGKPAGIRSLSVSYNAGASVGKQG